MITTQWRPPAAPLRRRAVRAGALGALGTAAIAYSAHGGLPVSEWYVLHATLVFSLAIIAAMGFLDAHHLYPRLGPANAVTIARTSLLALLVALAVESPSPSTGLAIALATVVFSLLDGVDGWLARRSRMASAFGARFDMEVDAALLMALSILAWQHGRAGSWVLLSGLMRYLWVAAGWMLPWLRAPLTPTLRGRAVCVVQIVGLAIIMVPWVTPPLSDTLAAIALAILTWSFALDVRRLWRGRGATA